MLLSPLFSYHIVQWLCLTNYDDDNDAALCSGSMKLHERLGEHESVRL